MVSAQYSFLSFWAYINMSINGGVFFSFLLVRFFSVSSFLRVIRDVYLRLNEHITEEKASSMAFFYCFESIQIDRASYVKSPWIDRYAWQKKSKRERERNLYCPRLAECIREERRREREYEVFSPSYWEVDSMKTSLFFLYTVSLFLLSHRSSFTY